MPNRRELLLAGALPLTANLLPVTADEPAAERQFTGQVVPLADLLKAEKIELEVDAAPYFLALKSDGANPLVLLPDEGSRAFYRDPALRQRPVRLVGRPVAGGLVRVRQFFVLKEGKPHSVHYWCEVCAIKRFVLDKGGVCECCGGAMERREVGE